MNRIAIAILLIAALTPVPSFAKTSGEMQAEWAAHGFKHGKWDCYGKCPEGRRHRR